MAKTFHLPLTSTIEGLITAILKLYYLKNFVKNFLKNHVKITTPTNVDALEMRL